MKKLILRVVTSLFALGTALASAQAVAEPLDTVLDCRASPHAFVGNLIKGQQISAKPIHVEPDSVNAFKPVQGSDVTAFGFKVYAVLGYQAADPIFEKGSSEPSAKPLYGVVVSAPTDAVEARLQNVGGHPIVRQVVPMLLTAIVCEPD